MSIPDLTATPTWTPADPAECEICGRAPAAHVSYSGVTGLIVARRRWAFAARACRSCSRGLFRTAQSRLMLTGWWSLFSVLIAPFLLIGNTFKVYDHRRKIDPPQLSDAGVDRALEGRPFYLRPGPIVLAVLLLVGVVNSLRPSDAADADPSSTPAVAAVSATEDISPTVTTTAFVERASLEPGECFDMGGLVLVSESVTPVPCLEGHDYELYARTSLDGGTYPGVEAIDQTAGEFCYRQFEPYVGASYERSIYELVYVTPTSSSWDLGGRIVECLLTSPGGSLMGDLVGQARGSGR